MSHWLLRWLWDEIVLHEFVAGLPGFVLIVVIAACIVVLAQGADWMIDGVVDLALRTNLPRIVIGATIISLQHAHYVGYALKVLVIGNLKAFESGSICADESNQIGGELPLGIPTFPRIQKDDAVYAVCLGPFTDALGRVEIDMSVDPCEVRIPGYFRCQFIPGER